MDDWSGWFTSCCVTNRTLMIRQFQMEQLSLNLRQWTGTFEIPRERRKQVPRFERVSHSWWTLSAVLLSGLRKARSDLIKDQRPRWDWRGGGSSNLSLINQLDFPIKWKLTAHFTSTSSLKWEDTWVYLRGSRHFTDKMAGEWNDAQLIGDW